MSALKWVKRLLQKVIIKLFSCQIPHDINRDFFAVSEDFNEEASELDEATRQFNFWTHQLHIFFVRKFFPAAHKLLYLKQLVREHERLKTDLPLPPSKEPSAYSLKEEARETDRMFETVIEEEEENDEPGTTVASVPPITVK